MLPIRENRREDDQKMMAKEIEAKMKSSVSVQREGALDEALKRSKAAPQFVSDMAALTSLLWGMRPPKQLIRSAVCCLTVFYGFGDGLAVGHADSNYQGG
jgi:hypothetical protein